MASPSQESEKGIFVEDLKGLNQRTRFNSEAAEFDELVGFFQQRTGVLERLPGISLLQTISGKEILSITQTFDSRKNVIVQTNLGVYVYSEDELMGRTIPTSLIRDPLTEEEDMAKAILVDTQAVGVNGGTYTTANVWQDAPLGSILSQLNPDGSAASFASLAAGVFTLAAGTYRFNGWSVMSDATANVRCVSRLFNVTTGLPAWSGLLNENGPTLSVAEANANTLCPFGGDLTIAVPTDFKIQNKMSDAQTNTGFGFARSMGAAEVYRWLEIFKSA